MQGEDSVAEIFAIHFGAALREQQRAPHSLPGGPREGLSNLRALVLLCRINSSGFFFNDNSISAPFEVTAYINRICLIFSSWGGGKAKIKGKKSPHESFPVVNCEDNLLLLTCRTEKMKGEPQYSKCPQKENRKTTISSMCENISGQREEKECWTLGL